MPSQTFSGYIDYIILGRQMAAGLVHELRSDVRFSGQKTRCAASCQITARYLSGFGWQTPSAAMR